MGFHVNGRRRHERGVSLVESLIVVGLVAAVVAGLLVAMSRSRAGAEETALASQVSVLVQATRDLYRGRNSFEGLSNEALVTADLVPDRWHSGNAIFAGELSGAVVIEPVDRLGFENGAFRMTLSSVMQTECTRLVLDVGNLFARLSINGTDVRVDETDEITPAETIAACALDENVVVGTGW
jgi:type II secretory pathway pseudopilin PulG